MKNIIPPSFRRFLPLTIFIVAGLAALLVVYLPNRPPDYAALAKDSTTQTQKNTVSDEPTSSAILQAITTGTGKGGFDASKNIVQKVTEPSYNWFVVSLRSTTDSDTGKAVLYKDVNDNLTLIVGPGTSFGSSSLKQHNVPLAVQDELLVYEDN